MIELQHTENIETLLVGIDIGSTTTKIAAVCPDSKEMIYSAYKRHRAAQIKTAENILEKLSRSFPDASLKICLTGSGAKPLAERLGRLLSRKLSQIL